MKRRNKSGMTLVELIVAAALVTMVLGVAFSAAIFGNRTFHQGSIQRDIQADLRLASDVIRDEIRYASDMSIKDNFDPDSDIEEGSNYIYVSNSKSLVIHYAGGTVKEVVNFTGSQVSMSALFTNGVGSGDAVSFSHSITGTGVDGNTISYLLEGQSAQDNKQYQVSSEVILLNMKSSAMTPVSPTTVATPTASPDPDIVLFMNTPIQLSAEVGTSIYYTLDESTPNLSSTKYTGTFWIAESTTVRAIAVRDSDSKSSDVETFEYVIGVAKPRATIVSFALSGNKKEIILTYDYSHDIATVEQGTTIIKWYKEDVKFRTDTYDPNASNEYRYTIVKATDGDVNFHVEIIPVDKNGETGNTVTSDNIYVK